MNNFSLDNFCAAKGTQQAQDIIYPTDYEKLKARIDALESSRKDEKIAELTAQLNRADLAASQAAQNTYLLSELKPCPQPAYVVPNPYCNCRCNCGTM